MTSPRLQNFSVPADSDEDYDFVVTVPGNTLGGAVVHWRLYAQQFGMVDPAALPILSKSSHSGGGIEVLPSPPMTVRVTITKANVAALLRNYYHEMTVVSVSGATYPVVEGIMTVTATENRIT